MELITAVTQHISLRRPNQFGGLFSPENPKKQLPGLVGEACPEIELFDTVIS